MAGDKELEITHFGPEALYRWLYDNWNNRDRLSEESKQGIRLLSGHQGIDDEDLKKLAISFAYEPLIQSLQEDDFGWFVDFVIAEKDNLSNRDNLEHELFEFRIHLSRTFRQESLWPSQGFTSILHEAIDAAARAKERLLQVNVAVNDFHRQLALQSVHEGVDRALLCAERFLELLLEFLARAGLLASVSTRDEVELWLSQAGAGSSKVSKPPDWRDKGKSVSVAANNLYKSGNNRGWERFALLTRLAEECRSTWKRNERTGKPENPSEDKTIVTGKIWDRFNKLRDIRNQVRHSSLTLQSVTGIPAAYRDATEQTFRILTELRYDLWNSLSSPAVVKVLAYNRDCFGGIELKMAMEGKRLVTSRFLNQDTLEALGVPNAQVKLLENSAAEFFVFPSASPDQTQIFNPLLIEREEISKQKTIVRLLETAPITEVQREQEAAFLPPQQPPVDGSGSPGIPTEEQQYTLPEEAAPTLAPKSSRILDRGDIAMHDPTGCSFLSYRRARSAEAALLIAAQHDRGIPTWQDVHNLDEKPLEPELRRVINDPETANAVLLLTPEVADSVVIQRIEAPLIIERAKRADGFFVVPVLAGGLDFADADKAVDPAFAMEDLRQWSLLKAAKDPLDAAEAARIAKRVLQRRLATIHLALPKGEPLRLNLSTRKRQAWQSGIALLMDWTERFNGRETTKEMWQETLLPALEDVALAVEQFAPGRVVEANGLLSLPAAAALGCTFLATRRLPIAWRQYTPGRAEQVWSLDVQREPSGFQTMTTGADVSADDLAVLVMVNDNNVKPAFHASRDLPPFRAILEVSNPSGIRHDLSTPGLAADVAFVTAEAIRKARDEYRQLRKVHLFVSVPAGLAMMIGQLLNTVGQVQTYEHIAEENIYRQAALLRPAD